MLAKYVDAAFQFWPLKCENLPIFSIYRTVNWTSLGFGLITSIMKDSWSHSAFIGVFKMF